MQEREKKAVAAQSETKDYNTEMKIIQDDHNYEQQYDPNNDFAIFGIGNNAMGGLQDMKEKMNMADKAQAESSSDEDDINQKSSGVGESGSGSSGEIKD